MSAFGRLPTNSSFSPRLRDIFGSQQHHRRHTSASYSASLWTNADDRLPLDPLGRVESGNGVVEGHDGADVRPQPTIPDPLDDLTQLRTIGLDDEINRQAVCRPHLGR